MRTRANSESAEHLGHVDGLDRVAQVGLVAPVHRHRLVVRECAGTEAATPSSRRTPEHAGQHRLDRAEHVVLRDERHLDIELIELARRAIGAGVLVAEAGRDLEIAIEAGDHQQLLELLRRLRQRVELARMDAARHQIVARAFGRARRQDRRLELEKALLDHPPADAGNHLRPQDDVRVDLLAAKIEEPVPQPLLFGNLLRACHLERQRLGRREDFERVDVDLDPARWAGSG